MVIQINVGDLITWIVIGAIAGWLASVVLRGRGMRPIWNVIIGLIGAVVGGFIFQIFKIQVPPSLAAIKLDLSLAQIIIAFVGAIVVLLLVHLLYRRAV